MSLQFQFHFQSCFLFFCVLSLLFDSSLSSPYNRITQSNVTHKWFEVGFQYITDQSWTSITTTNQDWEEDTVVFISLPSFGGETHTEGKMIAPKMQSLASKNGDNSYTFSVKLVQANDSFCENVWTVPTPLGSTRVSYIVMEKGAYFLDGHSMIVGSGDINRVDNSGSATVDNGNAVALFYPVGCEGDNSQACVTTDVSDRLELGALVQLQTSVNTIDDGDDLFLSVRTRNVYVRHIQLVMFPHSSDVPSYFELTTPEVVGYFVFASFEFVCAENLVFETAVHEDVSSSPMYVPYLHVFDYVPGLFGTLGTTRSLSDATIIRSFNSSSLGSAFITQEDQCDTEQLDHVTAERVFTLVVGEVKASSSTISCNVQFNSGAPSDRPTSLPSSMPSVSPSLSPSEPPSTSPSSMPTLIPTLRPSLSPSTPQTASPSATCDATEFGVKFTKTRKVLKRKV